MPMLGDILAAARTSSGGFEAWLKNSDPGLSQRIAEAASRDGLTPTGYVRAALSDFARLADEEDWATLTSSIKNSEDPGTVCLTAMIHWRLTVPTCGQPVHVQPHPSIRSDP